MANKNSIFVLLMILGLVQSFSINSISVMEGQGMAEDDPIEEGLDILGKIRNQNNNPPFFREWLHTEVQRSAGFK